MSVAEILIVVFGLPSVTLLGGIFQKIGRVEAVTASNTTAIADLWRAINDIREKLK